VSGEPDDAMYGGDGGLDDTDLDGTDLGEGDPGEVAGPEDAGHDDAGPDGAGPDDAGPDDAGPEELVLEEELRALAARFEPVPDRLVQAAVDAYAWRTVDADLAELVFDSLADTKEAALVRGGQGERLLSFQASSLTIEIEVTAAGAARRLIGQLVPPQRADVQIRHRDEVVTIATDELGRFIADSLPAGPVSLRCAPPAGAPGAAGPGQIQPTVVTDWVPI
jgi:hypothetical protein